MPSKAYLNFLRIRLDVSKLMEAHSHYSGAGPGRKYLGYLTRSGVVMLCAAWERYNEDLLLESIDYVGDKVNDANLLNAGIKKTISERVKNDRHDLKPIHMSGLGWRNVWRGYAENDVKKLNTPKPDPLRQLFLSYLGINYLNVWAPGAIDMIKNFVSDRGEIAHNGNAAQYIRMDKLRKYQDQVTENVIQIDSSMATVLQGMTGEPNLPWVQFYSTDLSQYR